MQVHERCNEARGYETLARGDASPSIHERYETLCSAHVLRVRLANTGLQRRFLDSHAVQKYGRDRDDDDSDAHDVAETKRQADESGQRTGI